MVHALGGAEVTVTEVNARGLAVAEDLGVTTTVDVGQTSLRELEVRPDVFIDCSALSVTGTFRYAGTWPAAIGLAASGRIQLDRLVTGHYSLDVERALTAARQDPSAIKAVVRPQA